MRDAETAAGRLGLTVKQTPLRRVEDIGPAIAGLASDGIWVLVVAEDLFAFANRAAIIAAAMEDKIPAVFAVREFVVAGGLLSYGASITERNRQLGRYLGRILKGDRPADLPIDQPTQFELVINLRTAQALGLTLPPALLARADVVVE